MSGTHTGRHTANNNRSHQINNDQLEGIMKEHLTQNGDGSGNKLGVIADAINTNTITQNSKIDTTNSKLSTIETDIEGNGVVLTAIDTVLDNIKLDTDAIKTDAAAIETLITSTNSKLDTIDSVIDNAEAHLGNIDTATSSIQSNVATSALQGTANGHLSNIVTSVQLIDDVVKAEDTAHVSGDKGIVLLGVRQSTQADFGADGDYVPLSIDDDGKVRVTGGSGGGSGGATEAKQDVIEATLTNIETDAAAIEVLITATNSKIDTIDGVLDSSLVKQTAIETLITSTNSKIDTLDAVQDAAEAHLGNIETAVQLIDDTVKAEDSAHSSTDKGLHVLAVRNDALVERAGTDGDYASLQVDEVGALHTNNTRRSMTNLTFAAGNLVIANNDTTYTNAIDVSQYSNFNIMLNTSDSNFTSANVVIEYSPDNGSTFMGTVQTGSSQPKKASPQALYKPNAGSGYNVDSYGLYLGEGQSISMLSPVRASHIRIGVQIPNVGSTITLTKFALFGHN